MDQKSTETLLAAVDRAAGKYFATKRDQQLEARLNRLFARDGDGQLVAAPRKDTGTGDAHGLLVIEPAGGGKSTLLKTVLSQHPLLQPTDKSPCPWIVNERSKLTRFQRLNLTHPLWRKGPRRAALI